MFNDKIVLITGAGLGAGKALAEAFAAQGAIVAANDISPINLDEVVDALAGEGFRARAYVHDVAKKVAAQALVNQVLDDWGRIDVLINSANVEPRFPILDMDEWDWHRTLDVNLTGAFLMTQSVGRVMRENYGGVMINIAPIAGREVLPDRTAYVISKIGLVALTMRAAEELSEIGVRVHAVGTGIAQFATVPDSKRDIVEAVLYLCGDEAQGLNGQIVNVD